jgi:hypothetical protein
LAAFFILAEIKFKRRKRGDFNMSSPTATNSKPDTSHPQGYHFSPNFVGWCANCLNAFHYFEPNKCSFIYQNQAQDAKPSSPEAEKLIVPFYCPDCEEALSQPQPTFAEAGEIGEGQEQAGLAAAEEWRYPTDEEFEDTLEWATERI